MMNHCDAVWVASIEMSLSLKCACGTTNKEAAVHLHVGKRTCIASALLDFSLQCIACPPPSAMMSQQHVPVQV